MSSGIDYEMGGMLNRTPMNTLFNHDIFKHFNDRFNNNYLSEISR
jgi:hypothetical protein